jgi:hypothetical protein
MKDNCTARIPMIKNENDEQEIDLDNIESLKIKKKQSNIFLVLLIGFFLLSTVLATSCLICIILFYIFIILNRNSINNS